MVLVAKPFEKEYVQPKRAAAQVSDKSSKAVRPNAFQLVDALGRLRGHLLLCRLRGTGAEMRILGLGAGWATLGVSVKLRMKAVES